MKMSNCKSYDDLPLFLNASLVAQVLLLLVVLHSLAEVPVGLLRVAVVAAAITAGPSILLYELQSDIKIACIVYPPL